MKIVFVAGPFTADTAWQIENNIRRAEEVGFRIAEAGHMPLIPHANTRFFCGVQTPKFWYDGTMELLRRSDAVVLVYGWSKSKGTRFEEREATKLGLPIYYPTTPDECLYCGFDAVGNFNALDKWLNQLDEICDL